MNGLLLAGYLALFSGNTADVVTTHQAFSRGAFETQGFVTAGTQNLATVTASKVIITSALTVVMHTLDQRGHRKIAAVIGFVDGGASFAAAMHNNGVRR